MFDDLLNNSEDNMNKRMQAMQKEYQSLRTGRASSSILDRINVDYYGSPTPLNQLANITIPDSRTIIIQPFDKGSLNEIDRSIQKSDIGINPMNDGNMIRLTIPQLTEERRKEIVKISKKISEEYKIGVRNERRDLVDKIKKLAKEESISEDDSKKAQDKAQKITNKFISNVEKLASEKEKEILEV